jgi:hypothetical protein
LNDNGDHQHYVPQFLLRNFAAGTKKRKKAEVHVFDKHSGASAVERIWDVAAQPGFYNLPGLASVSADPALTDLENRIAPIITSVVKENSIAHLGADGRAAMAIFCAAQMMRVPMWREHARTLTQLVREHVGETNADAMGLEEMTEEEVQAHGVLWLRRMPEFVPHFLDKEWMLLRASAPDTLYISDNPITLYNAKDFGPYGNLGLACTGIEIYLPLSSKLTLAMLCPSHLAERESLLAKVPSGVKLTPEQRQAIAHATGFLNACRSGAPFPISHENVVRLNSLQVRTSTRFVYSAAASFDLVQTMIKDHPELKVGARMQAG